MKEHKVYAAIVLAVKEGRLKEPFTSDDFKDACPEFGEGTYKAFLYKHRLNNPGGNSELFIMVGKSKFKLIRPVKYNI